ncbi:hypothetical protein FPQ18DRAFT_404922 [Pyronema domesticum]|uniref:Similar to Vacuolar fusion protein CCZ1 homolog acc. no. Q4S4I5 n=1 Tax=Pyronema omphalodes (strain CBS 100304) TaxID=1076935 RepID=U4LVY1_PYROM|nr:hypothetical protein FPQ18DRAFT_404922 [Pyronema domesticum]CCX34972.1 Similar to Vacuolar fusion protein CCZ1 homolog; acc. no. Q4S4I5 [Pyronema omphalodes CBS 100304]
MPPPPTTAPPSLLPTITPASLSSLAIYNPTLGATDETLPQQLVFHTSALGSSVPLNSKLRQIGLAQGISEFGRGFSGCAHTSIDTQKTRLVTLELEPNWWIHAEIALTCIHNPTVTPPTTEWNNREVAPVQVIVAQIRKAHRGFCFQYGTIEECWTKMDKAAFGKRIEKYWMRWAWVRWDPVIGGSPVVDVLSEGAIKMAGAVPGKELEDKEREWLRNWAETERKRGLVDIVVSRFGEAEQQEVQVQEDKRASGSWFWGKTEEKEVKKKKEEDGLPPLLLPSDGCVFTGIGNLDTREVANYLQEQYEKGDETYVVTANGIKKKKRKKKVEENPSRPSISSGDSTPTHRRSTSTIRQHSRTSSNLTRSSEPASESTPMTEIPPAPISEEPEEPLATSTSKPTTNSSEPTSSKSTNSLPAAADLGLGVSVDALTPEALTNRLKSLTVHNTKVLNLLTFGWGSKVIRTPSPGIPTSPTPSSPTISELPRKSNASFLIGFQGDLSHDDFDEPAGRITSRSVWLPSASSENGAEGERELKEYKIVVYTNKPFITALLYPPNTRHLSSPRFYRTIHAQLEPLLVAPPVPPMQKPPYTILLLNSSAATPGSRPTTAASAASVNSTASINTASIATPPNTTIPARVYSSLPPLEQAGWTRQDALHVYQMLLSLRDGNGDQRERSVRTTKGWWGYWMKLEEGEGFYVKPASLGKGKAGVGEADVAAGTGGDVKRVLEGLARGV